MSLVWTVGKFGSEEASRVSHSVYVDPGTDSHVSPQALNSFSNSLVQRLAGLREYLHEVNHRNHCWIGGSVPVSTKWSKFPYYVHWWSLIV